MTPDYRKMYEKGKFKDLLFYAKSDETDNGVFWQMVAYFNLGQIALAREMLDGYDQQFSSVADPDLRQNFLNIAEHLNSEDIHRKESKFTSRIRELFGNIFADSPDVFEIRQRAHSWIDLNDYICKYTLKEEEIPKLKREFDLLSAIHGNLLFQSPKPIKFEISPTNDLAAFIYKRLPGKSLSHKNIPTQQLLDLILGLQQLSDISSIRKLLVSYTPEIEQMKNELTPDLLHQRLDPLNNDTVQKITRFVDLCEEHLHFTDSSRTFVHGDLYTNNIIQNPKTNDITGVIDFERCWYSDPMIDFSKLRYDTEMLRQLLTLYSDQVSLDIDYSMGKCMLYRGLFILRRLMNPSDHKRWKFELMQKTRSWVEKPLDKIEALLT